MKCYDVPWDSIGFHDVPVNRSVLTEANRGPISYKNLTEPHRRLWNMTESSGC
jgi:hypothetical protein